MAKQNVTKSNKSAYQAAEELIIKKEQEDIKSAHDKLSSLVQSWEAETGCTFILGGRFSGNEMQSGLQVIKKPKK